MTGRGMSLASSVEHIVARAGQKKDGVVQPDSKEEFTEDAQNAMGAKATYRGIMATFDIQKIEALRGRDPKREFFFTIVGDRREKDFKVKEKHFEDLVGLK